MSTNHNAIVAATICCLLTLLLATTPSSSGVHALPETMVAPDRTLVAVRGHRPELVRVERMPAARLALDGSSSRRGNNNANNNAEDPSSSTLVLMPKVPTALESASLPSQQQLGLLDRPLRIAQIAPLAESVPPKLYGGTERIVHYLTEELVRQGHNVTLFASYDSKTAGRLISEPTWLSLRLHPNDDMIAHLWLMEQVYKRAHEFDVIHAHGEIYFFLLDHFPEQSVFCTLHGILNLTHYVSYFGAFPRLPLISISDDQRTHLIRKDVNNFVGTVHHGIPENLLGFTPKPKGNYLAFIGRITEAKRPDWAIQIAVRTGITLKIAAKVDRVDKLYWEREIQPLVEKHAGMVEFIGEITEGQKADFLGNAHALLFPIDWPEPFGLVMIEAMACGTPVIARRNGSVPEVIDEGVTGFIFDTLDEAVHAVRRVPQLDRQQVRRVFERRFTAERMAKNYLRLYRQSLLEKANNGGVEGGKLLLEKPSKIDIAPFKTTS